MMITNLKAEKRDTLPIKTSGSGKLPTLSAFMKVYPKLEIGRADDPLEREADETAERVVHMKKSQDQGKTDVKSGGFIQAIENPYQDINGRGEPLSKSSRDFFEPRFGFDFSKIRIHEDDRASAFTKSVNAQALTFKNHI
jgi:hypothetical protein